MGVQLTVLSTKMAVQRVNPLSIPFAYNFFGYVKPAGSFIGGNFETLIPDVRRNHFKQSSGVVGRPSTKRVGGLWTEIKYSMSRHATGRRLDFLAALYRWAVDNMVL